MADTRYSRKNIFVGGILSIPSACFNMFLAKTVIPELLGATINIDVGDSNLI
jgi:hypothetical protein